MKRIVVVLAFVVAGAIGSDLAGAETVLIRAGWIFTGREMEAGRAIFVRDGTIEAIVDADTPIPPGAQLIDASGCTVMPGLFDGHIHFMGSPIWQVEGVDRYGWGKMAKEAFSLFPEHRLSLLRNGITTIIEMGSPVAGYEQLKAAAVRGKILGPEIYYPGPLFTAPNGHPAGTIYTGQHDLIVNGTVQVDDEAVARRRVRELTARKVDFIKIVYDRMWYTPTGAPRLKLDVARAIVDEAHRLGLRVFAHVGSEEEARAMVGIGVDGIEHSFASTAAADALFADMAQRRVAFTPTIVAYTHYAPKGVPPMMLTAKRAADAGVLLAVGTDFPASPGRQCGDDVYEEMRLLEESGISRLAVLTAVTSGAAEKIGRENEIGVIATGARANLVFLTGRADEGALSSQRVERVMFHGKVVVENGEVVPEQKTGFAQKHVLIIPYPFWDPLTQFNLGTSITDFDLFNSGISLSGDVSYSLRNMVATNVQLAVPTPIRKTRVSTGLHFDSMNRRFYGIGNATVARDAIEYGALVVEEALSTVTTFADHWKLGAHLSADQVWLSDYGATTLPAVEGRTGERIVNASFSFGFDSREHESNPWSGVLLRAGGELSPSFLGTASTFGSLIVDAHGYLSPFARHIVAARLLARQAVGPTPFYYLPSFGGASVGRGYFPSRFSDRLAVSAQLEYRFPIYKIVSGVAWGDVGEVQPGLSRLDWQLHPSAGVGVRLAFGSNENSILGIDVGFSPEGWTLYFRPGHAF